MDLFGALSAKESKGSREIGKIRNRVFIETGEAPIKKIGSQFPSKLTERPAFDVLEGHAAQEPVRSDAFASHLCRVSTSSRQRLSAQSQQLLILKQGIDLLEHRILDGGGFLKKGEGKQRGLSIKAANHYLIDIVDYSISTQEKNQKIFYPPENHASYREEINFATGSS